MPEKTAYESGARKYPARTGPDPSDQFSQKAAENRKPPLGKEITDKTTKKHKPLPDPQNASPEPDHIKPAPRDVSDAPAPNPNGKPRAS